MAIPIGKRGRLGLAALLLMLPWFARNVLIKVALVMRARPLLRLLGHDSDDWPY